MIVAFIVALGVVAPCQRAAPTDTLRLAAVGDINLGRRLARARLLQGDTLYAFRAVRELLAADITFGNLESPIAADSSHPSDTGNVFAAPPPRRCSAGARRVRHREPVSYTHLTLPTICSV